ncbi:MAG: hypothetical protein HYZ47_01905 [Simkania negevensis]|nr:hypothetical protein [Simkania negevensis]
MATITVPTQQYEIQETAKDPILSSYLDTLDKRELFIFVRQLKHSKEWLEVEYAGCVTENNALKDRVRILEKEKEELSAKKAKQLEQVDTIKGVVHQLTIEKAGMATESHHLRKNNEQLVQENLNLYSRL